MLARQPNLYSGEWPTIYGRLVAWGASTVLLTGYED